MILGHVPVLFPAYALARFLLGGSTTPVVRLVADRGHARVLRFLLALLMNWPVKTAVLPGFIVLGTSTAVAITGESGTQDALLLSLFQSAIRQKPPLAAA